MPSDWSAANGAHLDLGEVFDTVKVTVNGQVERAISWVLRLKRLGLRYDRAEATLLPILLLAVPCINLRRLRPATKS